MEILKLSLRISLISLTILALLVGCQEQETESEVKELHAKVEADGTFKVYAEMVSLVRVNEGKEQSVHLIDMVHVAPEDFYLNVRAQLETLHNKYGDYVLLREAFRDSRESVAVINFEKIDEFAASGLPIEEEWLDISWDQVKTWADKGYIEVIPHEEGSNLMTMYKFFSTVSFLDLQKEENFVPEGVTVLDGDVDAINLSPGEQMMVDFHESCLDGIGSSWKCNSSGLNGKFDQTFDDLILKTRNKNLLERVEQQWESYDTVVLPWGANHMPELIEKLKEQGFTEDTITPIPFASCQRSSYNFVLRMVVYEHCQKLDKLSNVLQGEESDIITPLSTASYSSDYDKYVNKIKNLIDTLADQATQFTGTDEEGESCRFSMFSNWDKHLAVEVQYDGSSLMSINDFSTKEGIEESAISHIKIKDNLIEFFESEADYRFTFSINEQGMIYKVTTEEDSWIPFMTNTNFCQRKM